MIYLCNVLRTSLQLVATKLSKIAERRNENTKNIKDMLKHEFLELTKKTDDQVSNIDYARVEALYNELDDMSKQEFCRLYTDDIPNLLSVAATVIRDLRGRVIKLENDKKTLTHRLIQNGDCGDLKGVYSISEIIKLKLDEDNMPEFTNEEVDYIKRYLQ